MQRFVKVLNQNRKHVEAPNQKTGTPTDFTVPWQDCQNQPTEMLHKETLLKCTAKSTGNTCISIYFLKSYKLLDLQLYQKETPSQVFSCKYCKIVNTVYLEKHLQTAAF